MRFEWRSEGPPDLCGKGVPHMDLRSRAASERTPRDFAGFAADRDVHGAVLVSGAKETPASGRGDEFADYDQKSLTTINIRQV